MDIISFDLSSQEVSFLNDGSLLLISQGKRFYFNFVELEANFHFFNFGFDNFSYSTRPKRLDEILSLLPFESITKLGLHDIISQFDAKIVWITNAMYELRLFHKQTKKSIVTELRRDSMLTLKTSISALQLRVVQSQMKNAEYINRKQLQEIDQLKKIIREKTNQLDALSKTHNLYVTQVQSELKKMQALYTSLIQPQKLEPVQVELKKNLLNRSESNFKQPLKKAPNHTSSFHSQKDFENKAFKSTLLGRFEEMKSKVFTEAAPIRCLVKYDDISYAYVNAKGALNIVSNLDHKMIKVKESDSNESKTVYSLILIDQSTFISGNSDSTITVRSLNSKANDKILKKHSQCVYCLAHLRNEFIASGSYDKTIIIWNFILGTALFTVNSHTDCIYGIISYDNVMISISGDKSMRSWSLEENCSKSPREIEDSVIQESHPIMSICKVDGRVALGTSIGEIKFWSLEYKQHLSTFKGHIGLVSTISLITPKYLASGSWDSTIRIWDIERLVGVNVLDFHSGTILCLLKINEESFISTSNDSKLINWQE